MAYTPEGSQFLENLLADMSDRRLFALFVGERPHTLFAACARMLIPPRVVLDRFDSRWEEGPMLVDDKGQEHMYVVRIHPSPLVEVGPSAGTVTKAVGGHLILVRVEMREALRLLAYKETISQLGECRKQILKEFWAGAEESLGAKLVSDDLARFHFRGFTTQALSLVAERATNQVQLNAFGETGAICTIIPEDQISQRTCPIIDPNTQAREWERCHTHPWAGDRVTTYIWGPDFYEQWCVQACVTTYVEGQMWCIGGATDSSLWGD